jgi:low molecular weight phosphotyrosine protein phosphatase
MGSSSQFIDSSIAEAVFRQHVQDKGLESHFENVDSAGTSGFHVGSSPDSRTIKVLKQNGISTQHKARQLSPQDFNEFDYILCMDEVGPFMIHSSLI